MSFKLKVLRLYKDTNNFYLKLVDGLKQELRNNSVRNTHIFFIYLGRIFGRGSIAFEISFGRTKRKENRINLNGCCS